MEEGKRYLKALIGQENCYGAEEADSQSSIHERVLKLLCRTGPPSKPLPWPRLRKSKAMEAHCHGHHQEATNTAASSSTTQCLLWSTPAQQKVQPAS